MNARFSLGIDLGTSNSAVAADNFESDEASIVEITQILRPNQIGRARLCPPRSTFPIPMSSRGCLKLPWANDSRTAIIGHFAREHGALMPDRLVTSAKSWLSNFHVDPRRPVLPWKSEIKSRSSRPSIVRDYTSSI